jgi:hypothetical protein
VQFKLHRRKAWQNQWIRGKRKRRNPLKPPRKRRRPNRKRKKGNNPLPEDAPEPGKVRSEKAKMGKPDFGLPIFAFWN